MGVAAHRFNTKLQERKTRAGKAPARDVESKEAQWKLFYEREVLSGLCTTQTWLFMLRTNQPQPAPVL